jgi:Flp pilus assembly protein TadB
VIWARIKAYLIGGLTLAGGATMAVLYWLMERARSRAKTARQVADKARQAEANAATSERVYRDASEAAEAVRHEPEPEIHTESRDDFDADW